MKPIRPLVFYAVSLYLGCISYILFKDIAFLGAVLTASFLIIIFFTIEKRFFAIIISFFLLGFFSSLAYYNLISFDKIETIRVKEIKDFYSIGEIKGKKVILKGNIQGVLEGDKILVHGGFEEKGDYYRGIVGEFYVSKYKTYEKDAVSKLSEVKRKLFDKFNTNLGEEQAGFLMSICFGETNYLSENQKSEFQRLGVVHAISVSGFHMAVIYKVLEGFLGIWPSIMISFIYMIFTGAQPATIRAFIMILILKLSKKFYKNYDALSSLSLSALIILATSPYYAADLGFNLSYLATLGIILYYNRIKRALYKIPKSINESLSLTLSAQTFSLPYASLALGNISFGFIPGNLILLPIYTFVVICGNIALVFMNIDLVFILLCKLIHMIIIILDGAQFVLLKISPKVSYISYIESIAMFIIIISFILVKKGYSRFKAVPIIALFMVAMQYYSFFPEIRIVRLGSLNSIIINYKSDRILIYNKDKDVEANIELIKEKFYVTKSIDSSYKNVLLKLNKNYYVKVLNSPSNKGQYMDLEVICHDFKTIITSNSMAYKEADLKKCSIIQIPKKKYYWGSKKIEVNNYNIFFNKVYAAYDINN